MVLQLAKPDSQSIFMIHILWLMADLQLYHSYNTHSQVVMRFTLSPEHHSADGSSRHSRGIQSSLEKTTPSPFNSAAHRYEPTSCVPTEWELSLKILMKATWFLPMGYSHWMFIHIHLDFEMCAFILSSQYFWNWKKYSTLFKI